MIHHSNQAIIIYWRVRNIQIFQKVKTLNNVQRDNLVKQDGK